MTAVRRLLTALLYCGFCALPALAGGTAPAPELSGQLVVTEWPVPWGGRPRDPYVDASGAVWFCGQEGNYIGRLDPVTGNFQRYEVPEGTHPHNLIVDAGGFVWYAGNRNAHIGKLDPATGAIEAFPMPEPVTDPHTLVFDQQGNIWFTAQQSNAVGRLDMASGQIRVVMVPSPGARPYGIKIDSRNRPWIVLLGTNRLATVDPVSFELREIPLPAAAGNRSQRHHLVRRLCRRPARPLRPRCTVFRVLANARRDGQPPVWYGPGRRRHTVDCRDRPLSEPADWL